MNKASVKENQNDTDDDEQEAVSLPVGYKNYITRQGYEALRAEMVHLITKERPDMVQVVSWAASNGDRSENGDYLYGKKRLREIDRRIRFLTKRTDIAEVVDPYLQPNKDTVYFGATVEYCNQDGDNYVVTIVGVDESDPLNGKISWISPVARALVKTHEGDVVMLRSPAGIQELEVLAITYPESPN